jgi:hypothetical protein
VSTHNEKHEDEATTLNWKIDKEIDLYKFYLDIAVKAAIFLLTVNRCDRVLRSQKSSHSRIGHRRFLL